MNIKKNLYTVPVPSTDFSQEAYWDGKGASPAIRFAFKKDRVEYQGRIEFQKVLVMQKRAERCCKAWHIEGTYDTLVEIENSTWVKEIQSDISERWRDGRKTQHYMIYLDSVGCFEIIAESWTALITKDQ